MAKLPNPDIKPSRLARDMGVSTRTIKRRIQKNIIPAVPLGNGRYGLTRETYRVCKLFGLNAHVDDSVMQQFHEMTKRRGV